MRIKINTYTTLSIWRNTVVLHQNEETIIDKLDCKAHLVSPVFPCLLISFSTIKQQKTKREDTCFSNKEAEVSPLVSG